MSGEGSQPSDDRAAQTVQLDWPSENAQPVTSSLPPELFVQIFREVYRLVRKEVSRDQWATNWSSPYQLVCRSWRDVIRSTPSFWGFEVRVSRSPEWLEVCLERCAGSPAVVFASHPYEPSATFAILRRYASCIAECHLDFNGKGQWLKGLSSFLSTPLPLLDTLSINAYYEEIANVSFTHNLLPQLVILRLVNCIPPPDAAVYASLRAFRLARSPWQISYAGFLDLLNQCHNLESLMLEGPLLDRFLGTLTSSTLPPRLRDSPVVLPSLRVLRLCGPREVLFDLLDRLHMPLVTTIATETYVEHADPSPHISQLIAPDIQLRRPLICRPTRVFIRCKDGDFRLSLWHGGGEPVEELSLDIEFTGPSFAWNTDLEPNIAAAIDTFSFDLVDTLYVDGVLEEVRANVWQRAFQACRNLRVLHLSGRGTLHSVWQGLRGATLPSSPLDGAVCCPLLATIVVDGYCDSAWTSFTATPTLFEIMRSTLGARADQYGTRLKTLKMTLRCHIELWNDATEHEAAVEVIRELVEEFDYDSVLAI